VCERLSETDASKEERGKRGSWERRGLDALLFTPRIHVILPFLPSHSKPQADKEHALDGSSGKQCAVPALRKKLGLDDGRQTSQ